MSHFKKYLEDLQKVLDRLPLGDLQSLCDVLYRAYEDDRTVFIFGNGGSAALASHMVCDLGKGTHAPHAEPERMMGVRRLRVMSVTDNVPMMTAWANDASYEDVFAEQIENFIERGDVAFGISGSGNSPNVLKALRLAREKGAVTVGMTGFQGGKMSALLDHGVVVPCDCMQQIEDVHLILAHLVFLDLRDRVQAHSVKARKGLR